MVNCPTCHVSNSIDSQFCKGCGSALPVDAIQSAQLEFSSLVSEGYRALNDGRAEEAALIAQNALDQNPENVAALSLKGMAMEKMGKLAEALEAFERVVTLNPSSALDKIKVQQLRNTLSARVLSTTESKPNRGAAIAGAVAAVLFVVAVGFAFAQFNSNRTGKSNNGSVAMGQVQPDSGNQQIAPDKSGQPEVKTDQGTQKPTGTPNGGNSAGNGTGNGSPPNPRDPNYVPPIREGANSNNGIKLPNIGGTLPRVTDGGLSGTVPPVRPPINGTIGNAAPTNKTAPTKTEPVSDDPDPDMTGGAKTTGGDSGQKTDPGVIDISVSKGGGSKGSTPEMGVQALQAAARQQFMLQKWDQAARTYERLRSLGHSSPINEQRLAQCYERLGQKSSAASAYRRAIAMLEDLIRAGTGDTSRYQQQLDSCRQALQVLGG